MKRRLLIVAVFLLAGAVVNVAVAWGCVAAASWPSLQDSPAAAMVWPREVPQHWPAPDSRFQGHRVGFVVSRAKALSITLGENGGVAESDHHLIDLYRVGWPLQTLQWETWGEFTISKPTTVSKSTLVHRYAGHPDFTGWLTGLEPPSFITGTNGLWKRLPLRPTSVLAFVANTVFYAAVLWLLIPGPFVLRRVIRIRRGLCPACAYPRGESDVCSECGKELPGHASQRIMAKD